MLYLYVFTITSDYQETGKGNREQKQSLTKGCQRLNCIAILYQALFSGLITRSLLYWMY